MTEWLQNTFELTYVSQTTDSNSQMNCSDLGCFANSKCSGVTPRLIKSGSFEVEVSFIIFQNTLTRSNLQQLEYHCTKTKTYLFLVSMVTPEIPSIS